MNLSKFAIFTLLKFYFHIACILISFNTLAQPAGVLNSYAFPLNDSSFNMNGTLMRSPITNEYFHLGYGSYIYNIRNNKEILFPLKNNFKPRVFNKLNESTLIGILENSLQIISDTQIKTVYQGNVDQKIIASIALDVQKSCLFTVQSGEKEKLLSYNKNTISTIDSGYCSRVIFFRDSIIKVYAKDKKSFSIKLFYKNKVILSDTIHFDARLTGVIGICNGKFIIYSDFGNQTVFNVHNLKPYKLTDNSGLGNNDANNLIYQITNHTNYSKIFDIQTNKEFDIYTEDKLRGILDLRKYGSYLAASERTAKIFYTYIKQYPYVFKTHSKNIYGLAEASNGEIFAGYNSGRAVIIKRNKIVPLPFFENVIDGVISVNGGVLFGSENAKNKLFYYYKNGKISNIKLPAELVSLCMFLSNDSTLYYTSLNQGIWFAKIKDVLNNNAQWKTIHVNDEGFTRMYALAEDKQERIWFGQPKIGIGYLHPSQLSPQYFLLKNGGIDARTMVTDKQGTIWIGSGSSGLYTINGNKSLITLKDIKKVIHPFFYSSAHVRALIIRGNDLIINLSDKTLVLDLVKYYKGIINIKYLTSRESNYKSQLEHNTLIVAKDSTIWFSSSDMLYQWDFNQWLTVPKEKINIYTTLQLAKHKDTLSTSIEYTLKPTNNSFTIDIDYYHPDLLPRYFVFALQHENDTFSYSKPQTYTSLSYANLQSGHYTLHIKVLELDGSTSYYLYNICIDTFWWQKWWVISLIGLMISSAVFLFYRNYQKRKSVELEAKNKSLEIEHLKANTRLELSKLKVQSLANQIRPHFLLNTLNAVGASIQEEKGENLLDNLASSINLLFNQSISGKQVHSLQQEMQICNNIIAIYKSMYIPKLIIEQNLTNIKTEKIEIPFGLLQIPIENALQHGLRNKIEGDCILKIVAQIENTNYIIKIVDNGIGRKASTMASNARKHGTGLKNISEIISIFNTFNKDKIEFDISDNAMETGTIVTIIIPKNYNYDINA